MTREEFEQLLIEKGFEFLEGTKSHDKGDWNCICSIYFGNLDYDKNEVCIALGIKGHWFYPYRILLIDITEQKIDEILSQCTKIKMALEMINQIIKEG